MNLNEFKICSIFLGVTHPLIQTYPNSDWNHQSPSYPPGIESAEGKAHAIARQGRALLIEVPGRLEKRRPEGRSAACQTLFPWSNLAKKIGNIWKYDGNIMEIWWDYEVLLSHGSDFGPRIGWNGCKIGCFICRWMNYIYIIYIYEYEKCSGDLNLAMEFPL